MTDEEKYRQALTDIMTIGNSPIYPTSVFQLPTKSERLKIMKNRGQQMMNIAQEALHEHT